MKKSFSASEIASIRQTWLGSAITGGPNNFQLMMSFFDGKQIAFWLDDTVKETAIITGMDVAPDDNGSKTELIIRGKIKPSYFHKYLFSFEMHYNSHMRQGRLENAKGFIQLKELK